MGKKGRMLAAARRRTDRRGGRRHGGVRGAPGGSGRHLDVDLDRRNVPADRGRRRCTRRFRRPRRRTSTTSTTTAASTAGRSTSRSSTTRTTRQDGAADAAARRAEQGLRRLRQPRHRAEPRHVELPEPEEGSPGAASRPATRTGATPSKKYPWTIGYQPDYPGEAKVYGKYIATTMPNAKIGVLYQNDAYGKNYYAGLRVGLGAKKSQIVERPVVRRHADQPHAADPRAEGGRSRHVRHLRDAVADDHGARHRDEGRLDSDDVDQQRLGEPVFLRIAAPNGANVNGVISTNYLVVGDATRRRRTPRA